MKKKRPFPALLAALAALFAWTACACQALDAEPPKPTPAAVQTSEPLKPSEAPKEESGCPLTVTTFYAVPLDVDLQAHIINECGAYEIDDPGIVLAMIERESSYQADAIGDNGKSFGLMQVQPKWHYDRMERLGVTDLLNPYQNVTVGIDYLAELLKKYSGDMTMALVAYNKGPKDAYEDCFSKGIYSSSYSDDVLEIRETIQEGMITDAVQ